MSSTTHIGVTEFVGTHTHTRVLHSHIYYISTCIIIAYYAL
jgi:hypothetical protein